jgi:alpha-ketoglutarate-dependent 2,4-dichlorophenoxyacetate dioxygenase
MRAVYEDLPADMRKRVDGLIAEHDLFRALARQGIEFGDAKMRAAYPTRRHPLVRESASGRKALYLGWHAVGIAGWEEADAHRLLDELMALATQPRYIYSHVWRQRDLVIWDNRCTLHSATSFPRYQYKRDCRRTTINEYGPERSAIDPPEAVA